MVASGSHDQSFDVPANGREEERVADLLWALGRAYLDNGENKRAADKFRQLHQQQPDNPDIIVNFALALARCETIDREALSIYRRAVDLPRRNEALYLTLATLFLKEDIIEDPALKVYRKALTFSPPFEDQIRSAIEKIFHETTDTITIPELRQTLMDGIHNPELLSLYLSTVREDGRFDEAIHILKDLYVRSKRNPLYLRSLCETLLEKKAYSEAHGLHFSLTSSDARYCLKYRDMEAPIRRIKELDLYLDFKNLFIGYAAPPSAPARANDEYEVFILDRALETFDELDRSAPVSVNPRFSLGYDLVEKFDNGTNQTYLNSFNQPSGWQAEISAIAILEITNFDANPQNSKLPFTTFLGLMSNELARVQNLLICQARDGLVLFGNNAGKMYETALTTLQKVARYNLVVDDFEIIHLKITLHSTPVALAKLENEGLKEIRKAIKIHGLPVNHLTTSEPKSNETLKLQVSDNMAELTRSRRLRKLGDFALPRFPGQHEVFEVQLAPKGDETTPVKPDFGKYEIQETIRETPYSSTYLGYDPQLDRPVTIKAYRAKAFTEFKEFESLRKQFFQEIRTLNRITNPKVAMIYDAGEKNDLLYIVREYIEGKILNDSLLEGGLPEIQQTLDYYLQACRVLEHFHRHRVWHKNLKPDNVFLTQQNEIKLVDWGLLQIRHTESVWNHDLNSQAYSSPEQIQGQRINQTCDCFQLGVMLYESLTGIHPFRAKNASEVRIRILADDPELVSKFRHDVPAELDELLNSALNKNSGKRLASITEFASGIRSLSDQNRPVNQGSMFSLLK